MGSGYCLRELNLSKVFDVNVQSALDAIIVNDSGYLDSEIDHINIFSSL